MIYLWLLNKDIYEAFKTACVQQNGYQYYYTFINFRSCFCFSSASSYADSTYQATCSVSNVPPVVTAGTVIKPKLTITNTGSLALKPHMISFVSEDGADGSTTYFKDKGFGNIAPGASVTKTLGKYTVQTNSSNQDQVFAHSDRNFNGTKIDFYCSQGFTVDQLFN